MPFAYVLTSAQRANMPSKLSTSMAMIIQMIIARQSCSKIASKARNPQTAPLAVKRCTPHAAATRNGFGDGSEIAEVVIISSSFLFSISTPNSKECFWNYTRKYKIGDSGESPILLGPDHPSSFLQAYFDLLALKFIFNLGHFLQRIAKG